MNKINNAVMVHGTGNKKGNIQYSKWLRKQSEQIEELNEDDNVFSRLKKAKRTNTLFDKLKSYKRSK